MRVVCPDTFYHDGRGPTLVQVHLAPGSAHIKAIDYSLPDADGSARYSRHLLFHGAQVFMFTPEEVENYSSSAPNWGATNMGALVSLGKSAWLEAFSPRHLGRCEHFRAMFYDQLLDIICEQVTSEAGHFKPD